MSGTRDWTRPRKNSTGSWPSAKPQNRPDCRRPISDTPLCLSRSRGSGMRSCRQLTMTFPAGSRSWSPDISGTWKSWATNTKATSPRFSSSLSLTGRTPPAPGTVLSMKFARRPADSSQKPDRFLRPGQTWRSETGLRLIGFRWAYGSAISHFASTTSSTVCPKTTGSFPKRPNLTCRHSSRFLKRRRF